MSYNLSMWVVTLNPSDHPGRAVAREWKIATGTAAPTNNVIVDDDIDRLRWRLVSEKNCDARISRAPQDDPVIVESWL